MLVNKVDILILTTLDFKGPTFVPTQMEENSCSRRIEKPPMQAFLGKSYFSLRNTNGRIHFE